MPEYLAPGVYVEETSFRAKSIEGVGTSTTAFVGPTLKGPIVTTQSDEAGNPPPAPELLTSFGDFERMYGGLEDLQFGPDDPPLRVPNYIAHAVLNFFNEGGSRLYVGRVANEPGTAGTTNLGGAAAGKNVSIRARFGGSGGNARLTVIEIPRPISVAQLDRQPDGTLIRVSAAAGNPSFFQRATLPAPAGRVWHQPGDTNTVLDPATIGNQEVNALTISIDFVEGPGSSTLYEDLALGRVHSRSAGRVLSQNPTARADALTHGFWLDIGANVDPLELLNALLPAARVRVEEGRRIVNHELIGGTDGSFPTVGNPTDAGSYAAAFELIRALEDVSIVAAPGHSDYEAAEDIRNALIAHAERPRAYRIAVLDSPPRQLPGDAQAYRGRFDSHRAAFYFPWVTVANPLARPSQPDQPKEINLPPSGFICGIYARNDIEKDVSKSPANEVVRSALRFESDINFAQNQLLNPLGVNCLRFFPGRGYRVWGARTASSDPEWKYVNVRRYFLYLEASIDRGTQWAVFENNGPRLWQNIRETIEDFLYNEWISNRLLGDSPKQAYFVRCDRSTMTQNDLDNGRLICLIGVAALKPAEFVIFRIGQKTADTRS